MHRAEVKTSMSSTRAASTYEVADKPPPRRQYFREKRREYHRKMIADETTIKAQCAHLQSILVSLKTGRMSSKVPREASDGPLSWHSIAMVFKREVHQVLRDRQSLVTQTQELESLTKAMQRFVLTNIPPTMSRSNAWHSATLVADPRARNLGKKWLTQQMYHNMHEPFALFPVVGDDEDFYQFDFQASDELDNPFTWIERIQFTWPGTVQMFRRLIETNMKAVHISNHVETVEEEVTANTRLIHTTSLNGKFVNLLQGHFVEADRLVKVMCQVEHDEAYVCHPLQKQQHVMTWTEVRQISPTHILLRFVNRVSPMFRPATGFVSVDEFAALSGIDVTGVEDHLKVEYVQREMIPQAHARYLTWRQGAMALMHQSATN
ncbi:hypothetical protein H257_07607 [Aphanomyces astaci]|uniref:Uncharacterized protein n=1 Tax=Aphanomyces astaci TaxID=112090 RepID=W4GGG7_APHAT|nr:hypothetical protein H257_07607 [Aphanomyces astaci]ETV78775.1 hypothetical protein H257_07607 [Aphanomyces astaci]|eukprot:XP_009831494.1 hypothetical protein H257_07607 [Aphanomyces astaci]